MSLALGKRCGSLYENVSNRSYELTGVIQGSRRIGDMLHHTFCLDGLPSTSIKVRNDDQRYIKQHQRLDEGKDYLDFGFQQRTWSAVCSHTSSSAVQICLPTRIDAHSSKGPGNIFHD